MDALYIILLMALGLLIFVASLDDLIIDALVALKLRRPRISSLGKNEDDAESLPKIAVFVANWHEGDVLESMVEGNLENLKYPNFSIVLGVYPNDYHTRDIARGLAKKHPGVVSVVENRRNGPTSKGQMLNEMFAKVFADRNKTPDLVVMHDSEDLIAPRSFDVYAHHISDHALIQIPVFSLDSRDRSLTGATYMEEFAERHTREMILRSQLGAFVPSAGVGTGLRKDLIEYMLDQRGYVFQSGSVTEDYVLGAEAHQAGFSTTFAAHRDGTKAREPLIATLEYFPKDFWDAIKQKTRWVYGIAFESTALLGWTGRGWDLFFQYRDRKGAIANLLPLLSLLLLGVGLFIAPDFSNLPSWQVTVLWLVLGANTVNIFLRIFLKALAFREVYGVYNVLGILVRWPVALAVNAVAVARAWRMFIVESRLASKPVAWAKTRHELPANFKFVNEIGAGVQLSPVRATRNGLRLDERWQEVAYNTTTTLGLAGLFLIGSSYLYTPSTFSIAAHEMAQNAAVESLDGLRSQEHEFLSKVLPAHVFVVRTAALEPGAVKDVPVEIGRFALGEGSSRAPERNPKLQRSALVETLIQKLGSIAAMDQKIIVLAEARRDSTIYLAARTNGDGEQETAVVQRYVDEPSKSGDGAGAAAAMRQLVFEAERGVARVSARASIDAVRSADQDILDSFGFVLRNPGAAAKKATARLAGVSIETSSSEDSELLAKVVYASKDSSDPRNIGDIEHGLIEDSVSKSLETIANTDEEVLEQYLANIGKPAGQSGGQDDIAGVGTSGDLLLQLALQPVEPVLSAQMHSRLLAKDSLAAAAQHEQIILSLASTANIVSAAGERYSLVVPTPEVKTTTTATTAAAAVETTTEQQISPADLTIVNQAPLSPTELLEAHRRNAMMLSSMIGGVENSWRGRKGKSVSTLAVKQAQKHINLWLLKNSITVEEITLESRSPCARRICLDGVLGVRTKKVLELIAERDPDFWVSRKPIRETKLQRSLQ